MSLNKVGPSMVDLDAMEAYWHDVRKFLRKGDTVTDTDYVGGIRAALIAKAYAPDDWAEGKAVDRNTVKNSMQLAGKDASEYMLESDGRAANDRVTSINDNVSESLQNIRDELYQLRSELAKSGQVPNYKPYNGFIDTFNYNDPKFNDLKVSVAEDSDMHTTLKVPRDRFDDFMDGDLVMVSDTNHSDMNAVVTVSKSMPSDHTTLNLSPGMSFDIRKETTTVQKTYGSLINGTFTFGKLASRYPGTKEMVTGNTDDSRMVAIPFGESNSDVRTGFATTFRIPSTFLNNYLTEVQIMAKQYGTPGALHCYIIRERDLANWKNPVQAEEDGLIVAKSSPLKAEQSIITKPAGLISFYFYDEKTGTYPYIKNEDTLDERVRYLMIIAIDSTYINYKDTNHTKIDIDGTDNQGQPTSTYELFFTQGSSQIDLETNNVAYSYKEHEQYEAGSAFSRLEYGDLFYNITMKESRESAYVPYRQGLYTARFNTPDKISAGKARLTMRIAREGMFKVDGATSGLQNEPEVRKGQVQIQATGIPYRMEDQTLNADIGGFVGCQAVVIGRGVHQVISSTTADLLTLPDGQFDVKQGDPIYPMNYTVAITVGHRHWDEEACTTVVDSRRRIPMKLVRVVADEDKPNERVSDRLIFECDFTMKNGDDSYTAYEYNDFEIQIGWNASCSSATERFAGRIYTLNVSLEHQVV